MNSTWGKTWSLRISSMYRTAVKRSSTTTNSVRAPVLIPSKPQRIHRENLRFAWWWLAEISLHAVSIHVHGLLELLRPLFINLSKKLYSTARESNSHEFERTEVVLAMLSEQFWTSRWSSSTHVPFIHSPSYRPLTNIDPSCRLQSLAYFNCNKYPIFLNCESDKSLVLRWCTPDSATSWSPRAQAGLIVPFQGVSKGCTRYI